MAVIPNPVPRLARGKRSAKDCRGNGGEESALGFLATRHCLSFSRHSSLVTPHCLSFFLATRHPSFATAFRFLATRHSSLATVFRFLATRHSSLATALLLQAFRAVTADFRPGNRHLHVEVARDLLFQLLV